MVDRVDFLAQGLSARRTQELFCSHIRNMALRSILVAVFSLVVAASSLFAAPPDFAHDIAPILRDHCGQCHIGKNKKGGLSFNSRAVMLAGGDDGKVVQPGKSGESKLIAVVASRDPDIQMPPKGQRLSEKQVNLLKDWIDSGANWDEGFVFQKPSYEPPLKPRRPELPPVVAGRANPVDRIIDAYFASQKLDRPGPLDDVAFARRTSLDLNGLLPDVDSLKEFLADTRPNRRELWIEQLLADEGEYAEHWLTFWNDLLRNDYGGTGFITGGRKQISKWLYRALIENKPYDQMAHELIAPTAESAGFSEGIRWRGTVSAGQTVEIQFAQSVGQVFLGINLKCASCHDSFIDRWKLDEAYGLAAIYSSAPMEIHRCDKPIGRQAQAKWLFPELGQISATDPQPERLKQLARLMTHPDNGRFTRTIVNRLWHQLMGRGIVHPVDAMQTEPWNHDLLDFLAVDFADHHYDLKHTLKLIATSAAYQSQAQVVDPSQADDPQYVYSGPRAKRMTAEQFVDAVWQMTGSAPRSIDAPIVRGRVSPAEAEQVKLTGQWVWSTAEAASGIPKAGETVTIRKRFQLRSAPSRAGGVITCDNSCTCYVNNVKVFASDNWEKIEGVVLDTVLKAGDNQILIVGKNGGDSPNPAGILCQLLIRFPDGTSQTIATDDTWQLTPTEPRPDGKFPKEPDNWTPAVIVTGQQLWSRVNGDVQSQLAHVALRPQTMVRASLLKSDFLQRTLGRPNRDQIVTTRPNELSTLEAIDLNNVQTLADNLTRGAKHLLDRHGSKPEQIVDDVYLAMLSRRPSDEERACVMDAMGAKPDEQAVLDFLWAILMQPEFQLLR